MHGHRGTVCVLLLAILLGAGSCIRGLEEGDHPVVLSFGDLSPRHRAALETLVDKFQAAHPESKVVLHSLAPATDLQRHFYRQSFTAQSAFIDVFEMDTIWTGELAAAEVLDAPPLERGVMKTLEPRAVAGAMYGDELVAVPAFPAVSVLYYRTDLLDKHKAKVPRTLDELQETALRIGDAEGIDGFVWQADAYEGLVCNFLEYYRAFGGQVKLLDQGVDLQEQAAAAALAFMKQLLDSGATPGAVTGWREPDARRAFLAGDAVFLRDWDDLTGFVDGEGSDVSGKVGIALLPGTDTHAGVPTLGGWHLAVNKRSFHPDAAWDLVEFLTSPQSQAFLARELGRLPVDARVPLPERDGVSGMNVIGDALKLAQPRPHSPYYNELSRLLQQELHAALLGEKEVGTAASALVGGAREITLPAEAGPEFPRALLNPSTVF